VSAGGVCAGGGVVLSAGGAVVVSGVVVLGAAVSGVVVVLEGVLSCLLLHAAIKAAAVHKATRYFAFIRAP